MDSTRAHKTKDKYQTIAVSQKADKESPFLIDTDPVLNPIEIKHC